MQNLETMLIESNDSTMFLNGIVYLLRFFFFFFLSLGMVFGEEV